MTDCLQHIVALECRKPENIFLYSGADPLDLSQCIVKVGDVGLMSVLPASGSMPQYGGTPSACPPESYPPIAMAPWHPNGHVPQGALEPTYRWASCDRRADAAAQLCMPHCLSCLFYFSLPMPTLNLDVMKVEHSDANFSCHKFHGS